MNKMLLFRTSLRAIAHHKIRSSLTMLGIIVGIAAMIATLAIGHGAEERINKELLAMGDNYIFITAGNWMSDEQPKVSRHKRAFPLTLQDIEALEQQCSAIKYISPNLFFDFPVSYQGNTIKTEVKAGNEQLLSVTGRKIKKGSSFTYHHLQKNTRCAIIGAKAAKTLFKSLSPIGQTILMNGIHFTVIGVLESIENFFGIKDPNLNIFIPITTARKSFTKKYFSNRVSGITVSAQARNDIPVVVRQMRQILRARHQLEPQEPDDFMIYDQMSMMNAAHSSSSVLNLLLFIIASISLIVGGIGVMNIMLVCVRERTREIGIRMALGASDHSIMQQFLCESITLCLIGGIIGIILGIAIPLCAQAFTGWNMIIKPSSIMIACSTIVVIGIIFGYYPAYKASQLPPVLALQDS
jgi:putative ABC transport system permease protein